MRSLIVGNGLDIQYGGGASECGNRAIMNRVICNVQNNKYAELGMFKKDLQETLDICVETFNKIVKNKVGIPIENDYVFLQMELDRVRRFYTQKCELSDIGLEDLFLSTEVLYLNSQSDDERKLCENVKNSILQPLILDAIYNDGKVNEIYKSFPKTLIDYLIKYDAIFTLNYDTNIEEVVMGKVPVYHLHGCFSDYKEDIIPDRFKHMYCNGIMTWYWLEKYEKEEKNNEYGINDFEKMSGVVDIIGVSPCNDEQLYLRLSKNNKLTGCNYYYVERSEAMEIRRHLKGIVGNHITDRNVMKFWNKFK